MTHIHIHTHTRQPEHLAHYRGPSRRYNLSTIPYLLPNPFCKGLFSIASLIHSIDLFLQAGLEQTVRSSLPSRWARERPGPRGWTLYLKLNDSAEIHQAKAFHLKMHFIKLAQNIPAQIGDFSPWHSAFIFIWLSLIFLQQSTPTISFSEILTSKLQEFDVLLVFPCEITPIQSEFPNTKYWNLCQHFIHLFSEFIFCWHGNQHSRNHMCYPSSFDICRFMYGHLEMIHCFSILHDLWA